jgi:outer membrane protein assembly factor BamB
LHDFGNGTDGYWPNASLIFDAAGNLYGTTLAGGNGSNCPGFLGQLCGTVFELTPTAGGGWTERVLHNFGNGTDGAAPAAGLIFDAAGNLYSTTFYGGTYNTGTVFELTPVYPCVVCSHAVLQ